MRWDKQRWPNFSVSELKCKHSGKCEMDETFLDRLQALRDLVGPLKVTSGYRDASHPIEAFKGRPGSHAMGRAVDISVEHGGHAWQVVDHALQLGFTGIGLSLTGDSKFVHLDDLVSFHAHRPCLWTYASP